MPINRDILARIEAAVLGELRQRDEIDLKSVHVWVRGETLSKPAREFGIGAGEAPVETVPVLVDLHPDQNWTHPCEIRLYDPDGGALIATTRSLLPPADFYLHRHAYRCVHKPDVFPPRRPDKPVKQPKPKHKCVPCKGQRYALLFSGMSDNRHLNDLEYLYRVMIDQYGWKPANITVLNWDGTVNYSGAPNPIGNWPGDNTPYRIKVDGPGTPAAIASAMAAIGAKLHSHDQFVIHTNNHGGGQPGDPEACLFCYPNWGSYGAAAFGTAVAALPPIASLIVMMEQCHSGGFENATIANSTAVSTSFAAACTFNTNSMGGWDFDPFAHDWIQAIKPNPTSAAAAFTSANASKVPGDSPVYKDKPNGAGNSQFLA
ncbi:MAG TPA: hypothetical protein VK614_05250 [Allosphingosinicella sp.]|nr:hypothetical protein [Allosphingosinicella sp.]